MRTITLLTLAASILGAGASGAQVPAVGAPQPSAAGPAAARVAVAPAAIAVPPPADYVIGADDVLSVVFWRDKDMSSDVTVRPDGKISLPLLNDVEAAGFTPDQLRIRLIEAASKY